MKECCRWTAWVRSRWLGIPIYRRECLICGAVWGANCMKRKLLGPHGCTGAAQACNAASSASPRAIRSTRPASSKPTRTLRSGAARSAASVSGKIGGGPRRCKAGHGTGTGTFTVTVRIWGSGGGVWAHPANRKLPSAMPRRRVFRRVIEMLRVEGGNRIAAPVDGHPSASSVDSADSSISRLP